MELEQQAPPMVALNTSHLIKYLVNSLAENGDLPVRFVMSEEPDPNWGDSREVAGFVQIEGQNGTPDYLMICDNSAIESFQ